MHAVASDADPDRLSFTRALRVARRTTRRTRVFPYTLLGAHAQVSTELLFELLSPRRLRSNPRVVKRKMPNFAVKRAIHRTAQLPQPRPASSLSSVPK